MKKITIIGSGIGGLLAGNLLARRGHDVTIFESHSSPGGYTAGFRRKGYYKRKILQAISQRLTGCTPRCSLLTYERYTHNTDGATSAWSWNPEKMFHRSMLKAEVTAPVENLLIGSCWATQMGGIPGAIQAAYLCAKVIQ
jgi:choline dehydrogenase-like flavoprotein